MKNKAYTLTELLVGMVIGSIIVLTVGSVAKIGEGSFRHLQEESQVYNDIFFGFDLIQRRVANATATNVYLANNTLQADNFIFYGQGSSFIYADTLSNTTQTILDGVTDLNLTLNLTGRLIKVCLSGNKDGKGFNQSTSVYRRN